MATPVELSEFIITLITSDEFSFHVHEYKEGYGCYYNFEVLEKAIINRTKGKFNPLDIKNELWIKLNNSDIK